MRKLGTIDLEILQLAMKENGTFNETNLENSELKRLGVGKLLDSLASLKDRKLISLNVPFSLIANCKISKSTVPNFLISFSKNICGL